MKTKTALLALALLLPAAGRAQKPPDSPRVAGAVETSILEIDAVVTDEHGKPVPGLKASDFRVKVGGKPVAIENFYERRTLSEERIGEPASPAPERATAAAPAAPVPAPRPPRHLVLFLDRLPLWEKWKSDVTFDGLRELVHRTIVAPGDDGMIVTWDRAINSVVPFTSDLAALDRVLERERELSRHPLPEQTTVRQLVDEAMWFATMPEGVRTSGVEVSQRAAQSEAYATMRAKSAALKAVCAAIGGLPGRKILVHASHRFSRVAGLEFSGGGLGGQEFNTRAIVESVAEAANANFVTMYTFFPEGWNEDDSSRVRADARPRSAALEPGVLGLSDAVVQNESSALELLAEKTGGTYALGWREAPALAARVVADVESSYSLGVATPGGKPGKSFDVTVTVRNPELVVRARRAAIERTPEERVEARVLSNLFRPEPPTRLRVSLDSATVEVAKRKATATLRVRVPIGSLVKTPSARGETGAFSVFVVSAAADGAFSEVVRQRRPFEILRADAGKAAAGHFTYEVPVVVGAGEARLSVGVWDEVGKDAGFLLVEVRNGQAAALRR